MPTLSNNKMCEWSLIALFILLADQLSKMLVIAKIGMQHKVAIVPNLNFVLAHNNGAAFGLFAEYSGWQKWLFISIAIVISSLILFWGIKLKNTDSWEGFALACILGGAIGNLVDRIRYGYVIDFIDFYIRDWHWYTFNIADIAICVGSAVLLWVTFKKP